MPYVYLPTEILLSMAVVSMLPLSSNGQTFTTILQTSLHDLTINNRVTGRQPPPLSSVLYGIIYKRCSVVAAQVLLREKSGA
jgi:hypothetical protein